MKNLTKALGIVGITLASFLPMKNVQRQNIEITSDRFKEYNKKGQLIK